MKTLPSRAIATLGLLLTLLPARAAAYRVGDTVQNFALVNRATGQPVQLTDFAGKIVLLDWFAWWCPYCQAAAPQLLTGIDGWYATRRGNPAGIPVVHVGVNLQPGQESQTQNFVTRAGLEMVLQDFNRAVANRIAPLGGQPIFAIINGVTNSPSHRPWELLYSRLGYGETTFPVADFRSAIDAVKAPAILPPKVPALSNPSVRPDGNLAFVLTGDANRTYRLESSADLLNWNLVRTFTTSGASETVLASPAPEKPGGYYRVSLP